MRYYYRIRAHNGLNVAPWIEYYVQVLGAPVNFSAAVMSQSEIDLNWTGGTLGETGFKLYRKINPEGSWTVIADLTPQALSYTAYKDTDLVFDTTYYYGLRVHANIVTPTPHFSAFATIISTTENQSQKPNWISIYRLVRAGNGQQNHLYTTSMKEKKAAEEAGYIFGVDDYMVSSIPFLGNKEIVRLRKLMQLSHQNQHHQQRRNN